MLKDIYAYPLRQELSQRSVSAFGKSARFIQLARNGRCGSSLCRICLTCPSRTNHLSALGTSAHTLALGISAALFTTASQRRFERKLRVTLYPRWSSTDERCDSVKSERQHYSAVAHIGVVSDAADVKSDWISFICHI